MTTRRLTPYDTGDRLEPNPWGLVALDPNRCGLVDFDDEEGTTAFTVVGKRFDASTPAAAPAASPLTADDACHLLSISTGSCTPVIELDGDRVLVLDEEALGGLGELVALARRGRDEFLRQASTTDEYDDEDRAAADASWDIAAQMIRTIEGEPA